MNKILKFFNKYSFLMTLLTCAIMMLIVYFLIFTTTGTSTMLGSEGGCDILFHLNRIQGIVDSWRGGNFIVTIYPNALNGYGYMSSLFYPEFFLYIPAFLVYLGMPIMHAYFIFEFLIAFAICALMYYFGKKIFKSNFCAFACALLAVFNNYVSLDMFRRSALGESIAIVFIIIGFLGLYNLIEEGYSRPWLLLVAMLGLTYSHLISLMVFTIFTVIVVLINSKRLLRDKSFYRKTTIIVVIYLCLAIAFILPFIYIMSVDSYQLSNPWTYAADNVLDLEEMIFWQTGIGVVACAGFLLRVFIKKTEENKNTLKRIDKCLVFIAVIALLTTSLLPWGKTYIANTLGMIQFPWRLFVLTVPVVPILLVAIIQELTKSHKRLNFKACTCVLIAVLAVVSSGYTYFYTGTEVVEFTYNNVSMAEYLPINEDGTDIFELIDVYYISNTNLTDENGASVEYDREENTTTITFSSDANSNYYDVPLVAYKGYKAVIEVAGETKNLTIERTDNLTIRVYTNGEAGKVTVYYDTPTIVTVSYAFSAIAAVALAVTVFVIRFVKRKKEK